MKNYTILISQEDKFYIAKNIELWVISQWLSVDEAIDNIKEATELYLENNDDYKSSLIKRSFLTTISI